jgi:K+-sensing histidine kinase KdpD
METDNGSIHQTKAKERNLLGLYLVCTIILTAIFILDLFISLGVAVGVLYVVVVLLALLTQQNRGTVVFAVMCSLLIVFAFFYKPQVDYMWKVVFNRGISLFAVWITAILGIERNRTERKRNEILYEREKALDEIKILRGFLPICASCKKIRDDNGYWTQIEGYIKEHSEASFTHSVCPECARKLYPDYYNKK